MGCPGCQRNFYQKFAENGKIPYHYRSKQGGTTVELCPGSDQAVVNASPDQVVLH